MELAKRIIEEKKKRLAEQRGKEFKFSETRKEKQRIYGYTISKTRLRGVLHDLNVMEKWIFVDLKVYEDKEGYSWPGMRKIAGDININKDTPGPNILSLEKKGYIKIEVGKGKRGKKYRYKMLK